MIVTYNAMGGHRALSYAGELLLGRNPPTFGSAITLIEVYCHIDDLKPAAPTLGPLLTRYRERVKTMPSCTFYRKPKRVELALHSSLRPKKNLIEYDSRAANLADVPPVRTIYKEIVPALELLRDKIKTADDFDISAFLSYVQEQAAELNALAARTVLSRLRQLRLAERARVALQAKNRLRQ